MKNGSSVRGALVAPFLWGAVLLAGCSDVPTAYRVDGGLDPANQDDEVRFRTTYYMRVYETCKVDTVKGSGRDYEFRQPMLTSLTQGVPHIINDTLYRFRMTGQASALYSNLHFESGVLKAHEIDGFGNSIGYDDSTKRFGATGSSDTLSVSSGDKRWCPDSKREQQFFLLGPQGVRKLKQDDRLIMAMYTDSKPLIAALKRLSGEQDHQATDGRVKFELETSGARADQALQILKDSESNLVGTDPNSVVIRLLPLFGLPIPPPDEKADRGETLSRQLNSKAALGNPPSTPPDLSKESESSSESTQPEGQKGASPSFDIKTHSAAGSHKEGAQ